MSKGKVVIVLDVTTTSLPDHVTILRNYLFERMYNTPDTSFGVVLSGTEGSDVSLLTGDTSGLERVSITRGLLPGNTELVKELEALGRVPKPHNLLPALSAAVRLIHQETKKTHYLSQNIILLLTDESVIFEGDYASIATEMNNLKPVITGKIIGPELNTDDELSPHCTALRDFSGLLASAVCVSSETGLEITEEYQSRQTRPTVTFKGCLEVGGGVQVPVHLMSKITPAKHGQSLGMCDGSGEKVVRERRYHLADGTEVDPDCMNKGYSYGKDYIPISKSDTNMIRRPTEKELKLICTTKRRNIRREEITARNVSVIVAPPDDPGKGQGLAAFAIALHDLDMVAICRLVKRDGTDAQQVCLLPVVKPHAAIFHVFDLPFADEVKRQTYPPLRRHPTSPAYKAELEAVDGLIDGLSGAAEVMSVSDPSIARRFECVVAKAEGKEMPVGGVKDEVKLEGELLEELNKRFVVVEVEESKGAAKRAAAEGLLNGDSKKPKLEEVKSLDVLLGGEVKITSLTPVSDFAVVRASSGLEEAFRQMCGVISAQIEHSGPHVGPALACLRGAAVEGGVWEQFNAFIRALPRAVCVEHRVGLVTEGECVGCGVGEAEAAAFLRGEEGVKMEEAGEEDSDADLLDEL